mgnify:CR=1 FL=1
MKCMKWRISSWSSGDQFRVIYPDGREILFDYGYPGRVPANHSCPEMDLFRALYRAAEERGTLATGGGPLYPGAWWWQSEFWVRAEAETSDPDILALAERAWERYSRYNAQRPEPTGLWEKLSVPGGP